MIVQITPVGPGRSRVTTASKKDGGGGSQQVPRPGAVCSCNIDIDKLQRALLSQQKTGNRLASLGTSASATNVAGGGSTGASSSQISKLQHASTSGTSLDLSSSTTTHHQKLAATDSLGLKQGRELTNEELIKFLQQLNGDLKWIDQAQLKQLTKDYEFLKAVVDRIIQQRTAKQQKQSSVSQQQQQQQQQSTSQPKPKSYHMSNGDVVSSLRQQQQSHDKAHTLSRSKSTLAAKQTTHTKSLEEDTIQNLLRSEFFDRTLDQRHSSRSAEGGRSKDDEWTQSKLHRQRHLSGPSDLSLLKDDISEWLLSLSLARKREKELEQKQQQPPPALPPKPGQSKASDGATSKLRLQFKDELKEILKKPITRQSSGPPDLTAIKNDLIQWLTKQQLADKNDRSRNEDLDLIRPAPSGIAAKSKSVPKLVKRHSLGPGEELFFKASDSIPTGTTYPTIQYQRIHKDKPNVIQLPSSCVDIHRNSDRTDHAATSHHHRVQDRKLRHSASEVVTPTSERAPIQSGTKTFRYEYQAKTPTKHSSSSAKSHIHTHASDAAAAATTKEHRSRKDHRSKRHPTQRSATVSEMDIQHKYNKRRSHSGSRTPQPWEPCTDPTCPYLPICTDPNCYMNLYDTPRCASLPRTKEKLCASTCYECNCTDSKCMKQKIKSNSLPRCVSTHRSSSHPTSLLRQTTDISNGKSPRIKTAISKQQPSHTHKTNGTSSNGKLVKSISAASLNSRRRRHKTVHFGENLLREVCQNRKLIKPLQDTTNQQTLASTGGGGSQPCQPNIQMLYNFVEGVLSAWVDEDDEHKSGPESEPERGALVKPLHRCNRIRFLTIKRIVNEAAELRGALKLGNSRFRHRHWRGTAKECNERFLKKVNYIILIFA